MERPEAIVGGFLTPPGEGALHVLRIAGPGIPGLLDRVFRPRRATSELGTRRVSGARLGHLLDGPEVVDEALLHLEDGGRAAEITTHGGLGTQAAVEKLLRREGVDLVGRDELFGWESLGGAAPGIAREALFELSRSWAIEGVHFFLEALQGALGLEVASLNACIAEADESALPALLLRLAILERRGRFGCSFGAPPRLLLLGPPNAGKSSLGNRLLARDRSIVSPEAGTTRDLVRERAVIDGHPFMLADSAGVRADARGVEAAGIDATWRAAEKAEVLAFVVAVDRPDEELAALLSSCPRRPDVLVLNQIDRADALPLRALDERFGQRVLPVSALRGDGLSALRAEILRSSPFALGGSTSFPTPFTARQMACLQEAREALTAGVRADAIRALSNLCDPPR